MPLPVALLQWPHDRVARARTAALGVPRLLLVDPDAAPPDIAGPGDEDWVRLPCDEADVRARTAALRDRTSHVRLAGPVLRTGRGSVALSSSEAAIAVALLTEVDTVVAREVLEGELGRSVEVGARTLDSAVYRLRRRLRPLGLDVHRARGRGFSLGARLDWPVGDDVVLV